MKVFHFKDPADAWKRDAAVAEVLAEITYVRTCVRTYVRACVRTYAGAKRSVCICCRGIPGTWDCPPFRLRPGKASRLWLCSGEREGGHLMSVGRFA